MVSFLPPDAFSSNSSQELDVARALLQFPLGASATATTEEMTRETSVPASDANKGPAKAASHGFTLSLYTITEKVTSTDQGPSQGEPPLVRRPRSGSEGLDCLAALAERESHIPAPIDVSSTTLGNSSSEDDATMPPPKPIARPRSVSNPEDIMVGPPVRRPFFILPQAILEQELAQARRATSRSPPSIPEDSLYEENPAQEEEQEELSPEDLLRRARSRLLEDLSECAIHGDKNMLLPHSLSKYKNVYSKDGRIGIYTPDERAAILARFHHKRSNRNWKKSIRYGCRKNLADRRVRVKGRFVKKTADAVEEPAELDTSNKEAGFAPTADQPYRRLRRHTVT